jgi:ribosomal protein S12 methylthiotransferase accessory factor
MRERVGTAGTHLCAAWREHRAHDRFVLGIDHVSGTQVALPTEAVFRGIEGQATSASRNGIASGNSVTEAPCHALGEMLERHALAGFFQQGSGNNPVRYQLLERVTPPPECDGIHACLDQLAAQGIQAEFIMISAAANVAVFVCFLDVPVWRSMRGAIHGYGTRPDPRIAMARALGEAVQILALCPLMTDTSQVVEMGQERVVMTSKQAAAIDPALIHAQRLADHASLTQLRSKLELIDYDYMSFHDQVALATEPVSTLQALQQLIDGMRELGFDRIYSCVISPPHLPVVVVKTFCPGLDCIRGL